MSAGERKRYVVRDVFDQSVMKRTYTPEEARAYVREHEAWEHKHTTADDWTVREIVDTQTGQVVPLDPNGIR